MLLIASILYNLRYRGPYEYDKFILNIFQNANETNRLLRNIEENIGAEIHLNRKELLKYIDESIEIEENIYAVKQGAL